MSEADDENAGQHTAGGRKWLGLVVLVLALSMVVIDGTIVGVSLPVIIDDLDLTLTDAQWVTALYSAIFAALLLTFGRLGDRWGRRRILLIGTTIFVIGSVFASVSTSGESLIWARVVQGVGGAFILPATLSSVNANFRGKDRITAFAIWGSVISGMAALGPLLGGWLTSSFSWPWIFLVNVPIGVLVVAGALYAVPESRSEIKERGLDVGGLIFSALGFGVVIFAIVEGSTYGWWTPQADFTLAGMTWPATTPISIVPVLVAVGVLLLLGFVVWEAHRARIERSAILDLQLFRIPTFTWGNLTAMMVAVGEFGLIFVLPLYLVNALGLGTMGAGFVLAGMAAGAFLSGGAARVVADRIGAPGTVVLGLGLEVAGVVATALFIGPDSSAVAITGLLAVYGVGLGLASAQLTSTVLAGVPTDKSGEGSATQSTVRQVGTALGSAIAGSALSLALAVTIPRALREQAGSAASADELTDAVRSSAGGAVEQIRSGGGGGADLVDALAEGFSDAVSVSLLVAAGFLALGLVGSLRVLAAARRESVETGENQSADSSHHPR